MTFLKRVLSGFYIVLMAAISTTALPAANVQPADGNWPNWMGPRGNGVATASGMLGERAEFDVRWRRPIGSGYSAVSVAGERAITMAADDGHDQVLAFDAGTGAELWRHSIGPTHLGHDGSHDGPMSTPTIDGNRVFALSTAGRFVALDVRTGKEFWSKELVKDLEGVAPYYGFSTSPIVADGRVMILAGGEGRNNLVAFDKITGDRAWSADHGNEGTHATPVIGTVAGVRQVIVPAGDRVYAVSPADGSLLWSFEETSFAGLLLLPGDRVLLGQFTGLIMLQAKRDGDAWIIAELWRAATFKSPYTPLVHFDGALFGFNGFVMVCLDAHTGAIRWRERLYAGSLIVVDGHLIALGRNSGLLRVIEADSEAFRDRWTIPVFQPGATSYTPPSFAGGRIYVRNLEEIVALDIARDTARRSAGEPSGVQPGDQQ